MNFDNKKDLVQYLKHLINEDVDIDIYRLKSMLKQNSIDINQIELKEVGDKEHLNLIDIDLTEDSKVDITLCEKSWIELLPDIYSESDFLKRFLYGIQTTSLKQIEKIERIEELFIPEKTNDIDWIASWFGVTLGNLEEEAKRKMLYRIIKLYKIRGTKKYLVEVIKTFTNIDVEIRERYVPDYIKNDYGLASSLNLTITFTVVINDRLSDNPKEEKDLLRAIKFIINREKPAFTIAYIDYRYLDKEVISPEVIITGDELNRADYRYDMLNYHADKEENSKKDSDLDSYDYDDEY